MNSPDDKITPNPDVVFTELEYGEAVLLHLDTRQYFSLNETGSAIWKLLQDGKTPGEISQELEKAYDVSPEQAAQSVSRLVETLAVQNLVSIAGEPVDDQK